MAKTASRLRIGSPFPALRANQELCARWVIYIRLLDASKRLICFSIRSWKDFRWSDTSKTPNMRDCFRDSASNSDSGDGSYTSGQSGPPIISRFSAWRVLGLTVIPVIVI